MKALVPTSETILLINKRSYVTFREEKNNAEKIDFQISNAVGSS